MSPEQKPSDLHGNAPDTSPAALLLIDVISDFEFEDGEALFEAAKAVAPNIRRLKARLKKEGIPVIYVNDNFGRWQSNFRNLVEHCLQDGVRGEAIAKTLLPEDDEYFVLKPKHSGFYSTTLALLLEHLGTRRLVLAGWTTDICVLFTANDAYMRDFALFIPEDCVAALDDVRHRNALAMMELNAKAKVVRSDELSLELLLGK